MFLSPDETIAAQREKDESCTCTKRQKQGNDFEINGFSTV